MDLELQPLLKQIAVIIHAALQDNGGSMQSTVDSLRAAAAAASAAGHGLSIGASAVRGPDWKGVFGNQDGGGAGVEGAVGRVIAVQGGWCTVRWSRTGHEDRYRHGEGGQYEVVAEALEVGEGMSAAVEALVDILNCNLAVLRGRLDDRNFSLCLRVTLSLEVFDVFCTLALCFGSFREFVYGM
jgi:hypothetical protein